MYRKYNLLKLRALSAFENRGWMPPRAWAALVTFTPARAAYTYLKRLHDWRLLDRAHDQDGLLLYRLNSRGASRLRWLRQTNGSGVGQ
jgi:hypothetical protein